MSSPPPPPQHAHPHPHSTTTAGTMSTSRRASPTAAHGADRHFTIGFLGGGMMAQALIQGLIKAQVRGGGSYPFS
jgi:hypothetical protein